MTSENDPLLDAWRINDRITTYLVEHIPPELWRSALPGSPRRTVRNIAAHLHNTRCLWLKSLAVGAAVSIPSRVDPGKVTATVLSKALARSGAQILLLLEAGSRSGGQFPQVSSAFIYGAMPRNAMLFVGYALSHEAHHRGQILLMARELRQRLPPEVVAGLWQWSSRLQEMSPKKTSDA